MRVARETAEGCDRVVFHSARPKRVVVRYAVLCDGALRRRHRALDGNLTAVERDVSVTWLAFFFVCPFE